MSSKVSDGENTSPRKEKTFEGASNGSRYSRSYKTKVMDRSVEKKYARSKSRTNRPDETPQNLCPMVGPIKVRDRSWLMGDSSNSEESSKSIFPIKSKVVDTQKDEVSSKGKEKGKLPADIFIEETSGSSLSKFRDKAKVDDNLFHISSSKAREKMKPVNESNKCEYSLVSGNSPIKLREKMKIVDISKDDINTGGLKSQEKTKFGDDIASTSLLKMRDKLKISDSSKEGAMSPTLKDSEKGKGNVLREETSGARSSPIKLREKNKVSDEFSSGFIQPPKKIRGNNDLVKEISVGSACKPPMNNSKSREKGRMEKSDDSPSRTVVPIKMREKGRICSDSTDNDPLVVGIGNKTRDKSKIASDELKNGGDLILGKKEMIERGSQQEDAGGHDQDGIPLAGKREGKLGYSGKTRKLRTISSLNSRVSEKKPNIDSKGGQSRYDEKAAVSTSDKPKADISGSILNDQNIACDINKEEIMSSDVSSSQDQKILNKPVTLKVIQNRSLSRINNDGEWYPGDLAWGRVGQHPFWPCMVTVDVESGEFKKTQKLGRAPAFQILHVHFFGDKGRHSWLPSKNILKYEGRDKLQKLSEEILAQKKKKDKKFVSSFIVKQSCKSRWEGAIEEADKAVTLSRDLRKNYFENLLNKIDAERSKKTKLPEAGDENPQMETKENKRRCTTFNEKVAKKVKSNIPVEPEKDMCNWIPRHKTRGRSRK